MARPTRRRRPRSKKDFGASLAARRAERVFALDGRTAPLSDRFGLEVRHRRRWCPRGARPPWAVDDRHEWLWLYAAVEPTSGESFCLFLPRTDGACLELFLGAFRAAVPDGAVALVLDGSGGHTRGRVTWPEGVAALPLPAYSPELVGQRCCPTAERLFEALRAALANRVFDSLAALERALTAALRRYWDDPPALRRLTAYPWWVEGVQNITTPPA